MAMKEGHIQSAFDALCQVANERAEELGQHQDATFAESSEDEREYKSSIFDSFSTSVGREGMK